ncbi:PDZ domain-containing protein [Micromonospora globbae]|jgi:PDZ domain-containing protein|uniref:endopeptidase La n=1 Tax=Micromonospora globbae TaxID=1894969 RepID=A0A420F0Y4_9ACTN|nr:PDZ domain-containing protein [Micromonospora globbae]RKF26666.1 PDZ domain-containing protein [Micromonospora globbae]WTF85415.1 PDZ domain-containing protein [Micromonospora globbae]
MRRRGVTVLLGALLTALLSIGVLGAPIPYVVLGPGPTVNTLGTENGKEVIQVSGRATSTSAGQLRLTTVGVQPSVKLRSAIAGWFSDDEAVVPRELIYPPGESQEQVQQRNAEDFAASQTSAETAALRELGFPVQVVVKSVNADGPAAGVLKAGDVLTSVDGQPVPVAVRLTELIRAKPAGSTLTIGYTRDGAPATARVTSREQDGQPRIGVQIEQKQPHPFSLSIDLEDIGGPSAGLMFALGIVDKLTPADLTGGMVIAGTGTIDDEGKVGPIGGIAQKLVGAKRAGAKVFLVPADNCAEAVRNPQPDLPLIRVGSLDEALGALETLRAGGQPTRC